MNGIDSTISWPHVQSTSPFFRRSPDDDPDRDQPAGHGQLAQLKN
jgi:hypothetical protein